jgi:hypothetical protein
MNLGHIMRMDRDPPEAIARWGWRFHHLGIPTRQAREGERYLPELGMYVSGFSGSPYGVEWMRFEDGSPVADLVKTVPHLAFEVDDLEAALDGKEMLSPPSSPSAGVRVAMIVEAGAPVELIEFRSPAVVSTWNGPE